MGQIMQDLGQKILLALQETLILTKTPSSWEIVWKRCHLQLLAKDPSVERMGKEKADYL